MKCIDKIMKTGLCIACVIALTGCTTLFGNKQTIIADYEEANYNKSLYEEQFYANDLCVGDSDTVHPQYAGDATLTSAALFALSDKNVDYAYDMHEKAYPASTTKILTALTALNNGNLEELVTVGVNGAASSFNPDEQVCGLKEGDQLSLKSLLAGLILHSGNDSAVAIAEHVAGSESAFVEMMNEQAKKIMATNSHFITASGLHDENHYTTAYDLYLIFNECLKNETFVELIRLPSYHADILNVDGTAHIQTWYPTNYYATGAASLPSAATVIGGKTGYTGEAGNCLILLDEATNGNPYISIVMGAESKPRLYENMTNLINTIPNIE